MTEFEAIFALGTNFFVQGKYDKAQTIFLGLMALDPEQKEPAIAYGETLMMSGQLEKALRHFLKLHATWKDDSRIVFGAAKANILLGNTDEAKELLLILTNNETSKDNTSVLAKSLSSLI